MLTLLSYIYYSPFILVRKEKEIHVSCENYDNFDYNINYADTEYLSFISLSYFIRTIFLLQE